MHNSDSIYSTLYSIAGLVVFAFYCYYHFFPYIVFDGQANRVMWTWSLRKVVGEVERLIAETGAAVVWDAGVKVPLYTTKNSNGFFIQVTHESGKLGASIVNMLIGSGRFWAAVARPGVVMLVPVQEVPVPDDRDDK